jgi:hypothetical protein
MKHLIIITFFVFATLMIGCHRNVPLGGRITFADNGEPLTMGTIGFVSGGSQARGDIGTDGRYNLGFQTMNDGLPKGEYKIYIQAVQVEILTGPDADGNGQPDMIGRKDIPLIAKKYANPETSGLIFSADGKTKTFDIVVDRP